MNRAARANDKTYVRVGVAAAIAAIVVAASALTFGGVLAGRRTTTVSTTITESATPPAARVYQVIFKQTGGCSPAYYAAPWSATLGSETEAEPANATLPLLNDTGNTSPSFVNASVIVFSVPNGTYQYHLVPAFTFGNPSGILTVQGGDIMISVQGPEISCTT